MTLFYLLVVSILSLNGVLLTFLAYAYHAKRFAEYRISLKESMKVPDRQRLKSISVIATLSLMAVFGMTYALYPFAFYDGPVNPTRLVFEVVANLVVYDFAYYWLHRLMHHRKLMKYVHAVHHEVRNPTAMESFYMHPVELVAGLALLLACTWLVGPIHVYSFAAVFFLHSTLNVTVHSGVDWRRWWLSPIDYLTRRHYLHHAGNFDRNFASLTPFWDRLFGTYAVPSTTSTGSAA